jgi:hypothetical protein
MVPNIAGDYDGTGSAMLLGDERDREAHNKASLEARLAAEDVVWSWSDVTGFAAEAVIEAAALPISSSSTASSISSPIRTCGSWRAASS